MLVLNIISKSKHSLKLTITIILINYLLDNVLIHLGEIRIDPLWEYNYESITRHQRCSLELSAMHIGNGSVL